MNLAGLQATRRVLRRHQRCLQRGREQERRSEPTGHDSGPGSPARPSDAGGGQRHKPSSTSVKYAVLKDIETYLRKIKTAVVP